MISEMGDGLHRIEVPLPFRSPRSVNSYFFTGNRGISILDVGVRDDDGYDALTDALAALGAGWHDVHQLIGSHLHVDHIGGARRIVDEHGLDLVMHDSTPASLDWFNDWETRTDHFASFAGRHGAPSDTAARLANTWERPDWYDLAVPPTKLVADGARINIDADRWLTVTHTPGHQENHIALTDSRTGLWFTGDHVLPRISPFIPHTGGDADTLGAYLTSLDRIIDGEAGYSLPGHGAPIDSGEARARQIQAHHARRLADVMSKIERGSTNAWQIMEEIFRPNLSLGQQRLAIQETLAHIEHLRRSGRVRAREESGVVVFSAR